MVEVRGTRNRSLGDTYLASAPLPPKSITFKPQIHTGSIVGSRFSILLQGPPGSGKTDFMASCPAPFFLVWDTNLATHDKRAVQYSLVRSWDETEWWLDVVRKRRLSEVVGRKVETLCLDTLSTLGSLSLIELASGHAKLGSRDKWDEYYSRFHTLLDVCAKATTPDNGHPEWETYYIVAGIHEEPLYEVSKDGEGKRIIGYKPTLAGKMANANQLYTYFSAHFLLESEDRIVTQGTTSTKKTFHQMRTKGFGGRYCMPDKVSGTLYKELPEILPNTWEALSKAWGMV